MSMMSPEQQEIERIVRKTTDPLREEIVELRKIVVILRASLLEFLDMQITEKEREVNEYTDLENKHG